MPHKIVWSQLAESDFENILEFIENKWNNTVL
jgi:plasmid stabilization system protein ParE